MNPGKIEIIKDFVDEEFEKAVISLMPEVQVSGKDRNQIRRYGSKIPYARGVVSPNIPDIFDRFREYFDFDSVTINEYYPKQWISYHIDKYTGGSVIRVISLLSDSDISFKLADPKSDPEKETVLKFNMPRFSLTSISDELRVKWMHSVAAKEQRYSVVFRNSAEKWNHR